MEWKLVNICRRRDYQRREKLAARHLVQAWFVMADSQQRYIAGLVLR